MRTPRESCQLVHSAIKAIRKSMFKHQDKRSRKLLISSICHQFGVSEKHILNVMGREYAFSNEQPKVEQQLQLQL